MYINRGATSCRMPFGVRQPVCMPMVPTESTIKITPVLCTRAARGHFPVWCVQKLSAEMNVLLVGSQEVFGRHADGITSQPRPGY
jgi:hypothetical protein